MHGAPDGSGLRPKPGADGVSAPTRRLAPRHRAQRGEQSTTDALTRPLEPIPTRAADAETTGGPSSVMPLGSPPRAPRDSAVVTACAELAVAATALQVRGRDGVLVGTGVDSDGTPMTAATQAGVCPVQANRVTTARTGDPRPEVEVASSPAIA